MEEFNKFIKRLGAEGKTPDTIYLHRNKGKWFAYQHSALLLRHYVTPITIKKMELQSVWLLYAELDKLSFIRENQSQLQFFPELPTDCKTIILRCPHTVTDAEVLSAMCVVTQSGQLIIK